MGKCKQLIMDNFHSRTCSRNATKEGYCHQHHPDVVAERDRERQEAWERKWNNSPAMKLGRLTEKHAALVEEVTELLPVMERMGVDTRGLEELLEGEDA